MRLPIFVILALLAMSAIASAHIDPLDTSYENTVAKDFIMDAPWRVIDASTPIPVTVIIKDCDVDDVRELHSIQIYDENSPFPLWNHDFNDEQLGDDASEQNFWTIIVNVTEGYPFLADNTLLTPANLGYGSGDTIPLRVHINYKDDFFNYTETRHLRVQVGSGAYPWPAGWYGGDVHYHTMYTNNAYEYGAPLPAVKATAKAMGLQWLTATDHSSDMDETGDGLYSYATPHWEYTVFDETGAQTYYRNVSADGGTWQGIGVDVLQLDDSTFRLARGAELNVGSIDLASLGKTMHCLVYNDNYIHSPYSGAPLERPITLSLSDALDQITGTGFAYSSHPLEPLTRDYYGVELGANGTVWGPINILHALQYEAFRGLQIFNMRATLKSTDENNPFPDFDAGQPADNPYPQELLAGVTLWDQFVSHMITTENPRRVFVAGGSDAHGDFNYSTHLSFNDYAEDNAIGKAQTVAYVPGDWSATNLPPMSSILAAYRAGHTIISDGPFLELGIDVDGDGEWYDSEDYVVGDAGTLATNSDANLHLRWSSLAEFGTVASIKLIAVDGQGSQVLETLLPAAALSGNQVFSLRDYELSGRISLRAELLTNDGQAGHRAYTNPIEIEFTEGVPTLVSAFSVEQNGSDVVANWTVSAASAHELRLRALQDGQWRVLTIESVTANSFRAIDRPRAFGRNGDILYALDTRSEGEDWQRLHEESIRYRAPALTVALGEPFPNPFNPATSIPFSTDVDQQINVSIYDLAGRHVATLDNRRYSRGSHTLIWRGKDAQGQEVAAGVYYVRLTTPSFIESRKIALVR